MLDTRGKMICCAVGSTQVLNTQLSLLSIFIVCTENGKQEFDESKVKRTEGGRFGSKTTAPTAAKAPPFPKKPQPTAESLEKQRLLRDEVEEITKAVREATFGREAIARLQSLSGSFKKNLDSNKIFRYAQSAMQELQANDSLEKALQSAVSKYQGLVEQVKKGARAEEVAGMVSATSFVIGTIAGRLHGGEAMSKVSQMFKQKQVALNIEDIVNKGKYPGNFEHISKTVDLLKEQAVGLVNSFEINKRLI